MSRRYPVIISHLGIFVSFMVIINKNIPKMRLFARHLGKQKQKYPKFASRYSSKTSNSVFLVHSYLLP